MSEWKQITDTEPPYGVRVLFWWVGNNAPKAAHCQIIGERSSHEPGSYWSGSEGQYRPMEWVTLWQPLPEPPSEGKENG